MSICFRISLFRIVSSGRHVCSGYDLLSGELLPTGSSGRRVRLTGKQLELLTCSWSVG
jgi:hypothetical protein